VNHRFPSSEAPFQAAGSSVFSFFSSDSRSDNYHRSSHLVSSSVPRSDYISPSRSDYVSPSYVSPSVSFDMSSSTSRSMPSVSSLYPSRDPQASHQALVSSMIPILFSQSDSDVISPSSFVSNMVPLSTPVSDSVPEDVSAVHLVSSMVPIVFSFPDLPLDVISPSLVSSMVPLSSPSDVVPTACTPSDSPPSSRELVPFVPSSSSSTLASDLDSVRVNPPSSLASFFLSLPHSTARRTLSSEFRNVCSSLPPSPTNPYTPIQMAAVWLSQRFAEDSFVDTYLYKKVANKTRPVATTLPENFRIIRKDHPDPLAGMLPLPTNPPDFVPVGRITRERLDQMHIGKDFLTPEEIKLAEWVICQHEKAFAWTDEERGCFDPEYFPPIEIPIISHIPWALKQGPIPRGILPEVIKIIENKCRSGVYEPSSSSYNSRWFCVVKKDGTSLRLVHSLEPLNAVSIKSSAMPPYIDAVAEDFAGRSIYTTLDLYVAFDQRQLHPNSRDMTTFDTPLGPQRLTVLPMGYTGSPAILHTGDKLPCTKPVHA
jgi:hypothetical protein